MQLGKIILVVTIVISLGTAAVGYFNYTKFTGAIADIQAAEKKAKQAAAELDETKASLEKSQEELASANKSKDDLQAKLNASEKALEQARAKLPSLEEQLKETQELLATAKNDLQAKETRIAELEAEKIGAVSAETAAPSASDEEIREMKTQIAEQETVIAKLREDLASARSRVEDLQTEINNRSQNIMRQGLTGRILAVNQGWNFVVLNLGDRNGVVKNAEMIVKRGSEMIGKIRITSVEPSNSIADIVVNSVPRGVTIEPGDSVIYTGSTN